MAGEASKNESIPRWFWFAYLTGGFGLAFNAMMSFLLPLRAVELGIGIATIGLLLGVKGAVEAVVSVPIGGLVDRIGARNAFLLGTTVSTGLVALYGLTDQVIVLFLLQALVGVMRPMAWVASQSLVAGLRQGADQARDTGRLSLVATGAQIVGPLLVGFTAQQVGAGGAFFALAGYSAIYIVVGLAVHKGASVNQSKKRRGLLAGYSMLSIRGIRVVMFLTFARLWTTTAFVAFVPLLLVTSGVAEGAAATVVSAAAVVATLISGTSGRLAERIRVEAVAAISLGCGALGLALAPLLDSIPLAYIIAILVGIGNGLSLPTLLVLVSRAVSPDRRGLALGLRSSVNQVAAALSPILVASVIGATAAATGFVLAGAVAASFIGAAVVTVARGGAPEPEAPSEITVGEG